MQDHQSTIKQNGAQPYGKSNNKKNGRGDAKKNEKSDGNYAIQHSIFTLTKSLIGIFVILSI